jgi:hypothetical protein
MVNSTVNSDTGVSQASATISPPTLNAQLSGTLIEAMFGKSFTGTVATFTTPLSVTGWTATINWGDGTSSSGTITSTSGGYTVTGTHTYGNSGTGLFDRFPDNDANGPQPFLVSVTLTNPANSSTATAVSLASVTAAPPTLVATGVNLHLNIGTAFTGTLGTFTDSDAAGTSSFQVSINWGDGTRSTGTATANPSGGFLVGGTHTYQRGGTYLVFVSIRDADGNSAVSLSSAFVSDNTGLSSLNSAALGFVHSVEYFTDLVVSDYRHFLGRTGRSSEIAYWVNLMQAGATDAQVAAGFLSSGEFMAHAGNNQTGWLDALYQDVLGRGADAQGQNYWLGQLSAGASLTDIALGIETSGERESMIVQGDYQQFLGRTANSGEVGYWLGALANGMTNEQVAASFLSSGEYFQRQHNNASDWIAGAYQTVLSRNADPTGTNYWLGVLGK